MSLAADFKIRYKESLKGGRPESLRGQKLVLRFRDEVVSVTTIEEGSIQQRDIEALRDALKATLGLKMIAFDGYHAESGMLVPHPEQNDEWMPLLKENQKRVLRR